MKVVTMIQNISKIILNLSILAQNCESQDDIGQAISLIHGIIINDEQHGLIHILKMFCNFKDYFLQINLFNSLFNFFLPSSKRVARQTEILVFEIHTKLIQNDLLIHMQDNILNPFNDWHIISDICETKIQEIRLKASYVIKLNSDYINHKNEY